VIQDNNQPVHPKASDALKEIMCPWVANELPKWKCVCNKCNDCPKYDIPDEDEEKGEGPEAPKISYQVYVRATRCTHHGVLVTGAKTCETCEAIPADSKLSKGKVRTRKLLGKFEKPIGIFLKDVYLPCLVCYKYHLPHVIILSKAHCGAMRQTQFETNPYFLKTIRDYAERVQPAMNNEAQLDQFGNPRDLSLEGSSMPPKIASKCKCT
jgi:hypothetical protein